MGGTASSWPCRRSVAPVTARAAPKPSHAARDWSTTIRIVAMVPTAAASPRHAPGSMQAPQTHHGISSRRKPANRLTFDIRPSRSTSSTARRLGQPSSASAATCQPPTTTDTNVAITASSRSRSRQRQSSGSTRMPRQSVRKAAKERNRSVNPADTLTAPKSDTPQAASVAAAAATMGDRRAELSSRRLTVDRHRISGTQTTSPTSSARSRGSCDTS